MYIVIGTTTYTEISDLTFAPETDVTGSSVPVNELWASIRTDDAIEIGERVSLYDDLDQLWCKYWVTYAEREDAYTMRVHGQSALMKLDTVTLEPKMYANEAVGVVVAQILSSLGSAYTLDSAFNSETISGFCPKQSARVRLQWVCMVIGAYIKDAFNDQLEILEMDDEEQAIIPVEKTYWKPKVTYRDYVTAVRATYYSYVEGVPARRDNYVEADDVTYVETSAQITLTNPNVPPAAMENVVEVDGVKIINQDNVSSVLSFLAKYHFERTKVDLECVNNREFLVGQRVFYFTDPETMHSGYINGCSFRFGLQAKASMTMTPTEVRQSATLTIIYLWDDVQVGIRVYRLPVGYAYEVENPYLQTNFNYHRYVFRPEHATISGTMTSVGRTVEEPVYVALDQHLYELDVISVDEVTRDEEFTDGKIEVIK